MNPVLADGLDGGVVGDVTVLRVHVGRIILSVDEHRAVLHHVELNIVDRRGGLDIGHIRLDQRQRRQRNIDAVTDDVHLHLLAGTGSDIGGNADIHGFGDLSLHAVIPDIILHLENSIAACDDVSASQLLDIDLRTFRRGNADGMGRHVIEDGSGHLYLGVFIRQLPFIKRRKV
ncbi:hypothetical protein SDC9_163424 [bioreactor metagenome]|uniref:NAD-specific glutamate dehydrogenase n=1 Tax=bioreactor metagenome TaxID=1076179 RepID=A0A645FQV0_9ZZZZ